MSRGNPRGAAEAFEERRLSLFPAGARWIAHRPPGKYLNALLLVVGPRVEARSRAFLSPSAIHYPPFAIPRPSTVDRQLSALTTSHNNALYTGKPEMGSRLSGSVSSLTLHVRHGPRAMGLPPPALASMTPGRMSWLTQAV
jgi:hypothetical protein